MRSLAMMTLAGTAALLLACGRDQAGDRPATADGEAGDTPAASPPAAPAPPESAAPPDTAEPPADVPAAPVAPADTGWTVGSLRAPAPAGVATLRAVRAARNDGFDRIVFDFGAGPLPGYRIEYVDRPQHECGSGNEVRLAGDAWLQLDMEPARAHDDQGRATVAERASRPNLNNLIEMRSICDFEAHLSWVMGVRMPGRFRVLRLREPHRLVVDVRH